MIFIAIEIYNKKLEKLLMNSNSLIKSVGLEMAKKIKIRLNQMMAAKNFKEYLDIGIGKPHPLSGNLDNSFAVLLDKNYRLIVEPITDKYDSESLRICYKVNIKGVVDYHDGGCKWLIP